MRPTRLIPMLPVMALLAACAPPPEPAPPPPPPSAMLPPSPDTCGATPVMRLVGQPITAFDPTTIRGPVRVIGPGTMVTQDYAPSRLNVSHNEAQVIDRISCG